MIHVLYGADSFSLKERLQTIKDGLGSADLLEFNSQVLDGATLTPEHFAGICQAMPFMVARRLVIVEGLLTRFAPSRKPPAASHPGESTRAADEPGEKDEVPENTPAEKKPWQAFAAVLRTIPETTVLVLVDGELRGKNPLLADIAPIARVELFHPLKADVLFQWVQNRAAGYGCKLGHETINYLLDILGDNLWLIDSELKKLGLYARDQTITISDIDQIVSYSREGNIFQLVDAILQRRTRRAMELLRQLQNAGAGAPYLLAMLTREVRRLLLAKLISAGIPPPPELARELKLVEERDVRIITGKAARYTRPALEALYRPILQTDLAVKRGKDPDLAIELLLNEICSGAAAR